MERSEALPITHARSSVRLLNIVLMAGATAVAAQIEIPHLPVPYTLQTLAVLLSGVLLGAKRGALSQILYLLCGLAGLPVFAQFGAGFARLIGPTGGYLLSFPVAAFAVGYLMNSQAGFLRSLLALSVGSLIIFSLGTLQLNFLYYHDWPSAFTNGFLIFSWWDALKILAGASVAVSLHRWKRRQE